LVLISCEYSFSVSDIRLAKNDVHYQDPSRTGSHVYHPIW